MKVEATWQNLPPPFIFRLCLLFICVTQKVLPNISHLLFTCKRRNTFIISLGVVTTMKQPLFLLTSIFVVQTLQDPVLLLSICNVEWKRKREREKEWEECGWEVWNVNWKSIIKGYLHTSLRSISKPSQSAVCFKTNWLYIPITSCAFPIYCLVV